MLIPEEGGRQVGVCFHLDLRVGRFKCVLKGGAEEGLLMGKCVTHSSLLTVGGL